MTDPLTTLREHLGDRYEVERELGRGGMATVYLARDLKHGRPVAIKVLRPDLAAGMGASAFLQEIRLTAGLQHPLILPLHDSGQAGELLYYVMPYVEGESLRDRLTREHQLPVRDAIAIVRDVAEALAYAHERDVVHRDIKPENILLTGGHAVAADFGIARAIQVASDAATLPQSETVSGTPAYMSPEQASGGAVDGRTDLYALGVVLYEMLAGSPPFVEPTAQALLKRILADPPPPLLEKRPSVPAPLDAAVRTALEKIPADRFSSAADFRDALEGIVSDTGRTRTQAAIPAAAARGSPASASPLRVLAWFAIAASLVLAAVVYLVVALGLPDWVLGAAIVLLIVGLPVLLTAAGLERKRASEREEGVVPEPSSGWGGILRRLTLRNAWIGGGIAFVLLVVAVAGYGISRKLGVGPAASLVSAGVLSERDKVLVADFENGTPDSLLDETVKEALSVDLSQSRTFGVVPSQQVSEALGRMEKEPGTPLTPDLARELALREGIKAVLTGSILPAGNGYVLSAKLLEPEKGNVLAAFREGADGPGQVIEAIDRLSHAVREKIGESLRTIRANPPLASVTTSSLEALRLYSQGVRAAEYEGNDGKAMALLEEAVSLDTTFAMAYRKLGTVLANNNQDPDKAARALTEAYRHRDRLPERERYLAEGSYYMTVSRDLPKAATAYQSLIGINPHDSWALNNLGVAHSDMGDPEHALEFYRRAEAEEASPLVITNVAVAQLQLGRYQDSARTLDDLDARFPDNPLRFVYRMFLASAQWRFPEAESLVLIYRSKVPENQFAQTRSHMTVSAMAASQGQLARADRETDLALDLARRSGIGDLYYKSLVSLAHREAFARGDTKQAAQSVDRGLADFPLSRIPPVERPYDALAGVFAEAGDVRRARDLLDEQQRVLSETERHGKEAGRQSALGMIALAEGRPADAVGKFQAARRADPSDLVGGLALIGRSYEQMGEPDSALAAYERYLQTPCDVRFIQDQVFLGGTLIRAAELREKKGDLARAIAWYSRFVDLWKDADPEFQGRVRAARQKIEQLTAEQGRS